jgi:hypothetical protein
MPRRRRPRTEPEPSSNCQARTEEGRIGLERPDDTRPKRGETSGKCLARSAAKPDLRLVRTVSDRNPSVANIAKADPHGDFGKG